MIKPLALGTLTVASLSALVTFCIPLPWGGPLFAVLASIFPPVLMAVGAERRGRLGRQVIPISLLALALLLVMAGLFGFRGRGLDGPWWGGLPAAAAVQLYGLFLLPLGVSSLGYALTFDRWGLRQNDLDDLRDRFPESLEVDQSRESP